MFLDSAPEPKHARLGPSNSRWPFCPGSVREEAAYPDVSSEAAIDGTGSHLLLELCLNNGVRAEAYEGQVIGENDIEKPNGWIIHRDRADRVQMCLDYIERRVRELKSMYPGSRVIVEAETKADPGGAFGRKDWWGTCDITITVINHHNRCVFMEVVDYKDGRMYVSAEDNTQLLAYLFGKLRPFIASGPELVRPIEPRLVGNACQMTIVQPKTTPVVRPVTISAYQLVDEIEWLRERAIATDNPDAELIPDEKGGKGYCTFCKHKPNCIALKENATSSLGDLTKTLAEKQMSNDLQQPKLDMLMNADVRTLSHDQLAQLADAEPAITQIFDQAKKEIQRRIEDDNVSFNHLGYAMLPGKPQRVWAKPDADIEKALRGRRIKKGDMFPAKLITFPALEKSGLLKPDQLKKIEDDLVTQVSSGKKSLQRVARKSEGRTAEQMFGHIVEGEPEAESLSFMAEPEDVSFF